MRKIVMRGTMNKPKLVTIVVLNDGETYTDVDGVSICIIKESEYEKLLQGYNPRDIEVVQEIGLYRA